MDWSNAVTAFAAKEAVDASRVTAARRHNRDVDPRTPTALICGVDEAGRGPWAGPVCAAAVVLDPWKPIRGLADSKTLPERKRLTLFEEIRRSCLTFGIGWASPFDIDRVNIRVATHSAMERAVSLARIGLRGPQAIGLVRIDGHEIPPGLDVTAESLVGGDALDPSISAASILAKTARDRHMARLCRRYPALGLSRHKGYGTAAHAEQLDRLGPSPTHRMSFRPVMARAT